MKPIVYNVSSKLSLFFSDLTIKLNRIMGKDKLIEQMLKEKGDNNNSIDLDAYCRGLIDMYEHLQSKLNNNEVLGIVSERELTSEDLVWYEDVIYELDSIDGETAYITSLKCKTYEIVRKEQLTLVR